MHLNIGDMCLRLQSAFSIRIVYLRSTLVICTYLEVRMGRKKINKNEEMPTRSISDRIRVGIESENGWKHKEKEAGATRIPENPKR